MGDGIITLTPWDDDTATPIKAGDSRVRLGGKPPECDCRVLSEPNYQRAVACVNALAGIDDPGAAIAALVKAARQCGHELRVIAEHHGESLVDFGPVHAVDEALRSMGLATRKSVE